MAATWGDQNIFTHMVRPANNTPVGTQPPPGGTTPPTTNKNNPYAQFGDISQYQTRFGDTQGLYGTSSKYPLFGLGGLLNSDPFRTARNGDGQFDEINFLSSNSIGGVPLYRRNTETGRMEINPEGRYGELNSQFKGLDFRLEDDPSLGYEDERPNMRLMWNPEVLPQDRFGNRGTSADVTGYEDGRNGTLLNPDLVYDDPFYGRITHPRNMQQHTNWIDGLMDMTGPLLMSIAGLGLGGALGGAGLLGGGFSPSTIMGLGQGARGAMNGNIGSLLASIASMGMGPLTGLSGMPLNLARTGTSMAMNQLLNRGGRG